MLITTSSLPATTFWHAHGVDRRNGDDGDRGYNNVRDDNAGVHEPCGNGGRDVDVQQLPGGAVQPQQRVNDGGNDDDDGDVVHLQSPM